MSNPEKRSLLAQRVARHLAAVTVAAVTAGTAPAAVQYMAVNLVVPNNNDGLYINVETLATGSAGSAVAGWDINPYSATSLTWFNATGTGMMRYPGITTGSAGNLPIGTIVGASGSYGSGAVVVGSAAGNWQLNAQNRFGFRFIAADGQTHYGWGTFQIGTSISGADRTITELAWETSPGVAIFVGSTGGGDCDQNGIPDSCQIAQNPALDCDNDGILNSCEIASGSATDCDLNGIPDSCQIANGSAADCDLNGIPDSCQIANGSATDCNANGVLDSCDIAAGFPDCDSDGRPDSCEGAVRFAQEFTGPISTAAPSEFTFTGLSRAYTGTPRIEVRAVADLGATTDGLVVTLDGGTGTSIFVTDGTDCPATPNLATITRDIPAFNALVADGQLVVRVTAFGGVNSANCANGSLKVRLVYEALPAASDCNGNGLLDSCELGTGAQPDCNANGTIDSCDIASGVAADCNGNARPDSCDLALGSSTDLDGNGRLDECSGEYIVGGSGFATVQAAIDGAPDGATVRVAPGVYGPISLTARALTLVSLGGASQTFIDGGGTARGFSMQSAGQGATAVDGFTFRNCYAVTGAAARITLSAPEFRNCVFTANLAAERGGAVALLSSPARFVQCQFVDNDCSGTGGALYVSGEPVDGQAVVVDSVFTGNHAGTIGGAVLNEGRLLLDGCLVVANSSLIAGGGASFLSTGVVQLRDSRFCRNLPDNVQGSFDDLGGNTFGIDCNQNGICDADEIAAGSATDCDGDGLLDSCELASGAPDCNENGVPDSCDLASGASNDVDQNGVPDECKPDCDGDGLPDAYEIATGLEPDCNANSVIDSCDIDAGMGDDDGDGRPDACEFALGDLDLNGIVNASDITILLVFWGTPNPVIDPNGDGVVNAQDLAVLLDNWGPVG